MGILQAIAKTSLQFRILKRKSLLAHFFPNIYCLTNTIAATEITLFVTSDEKYTRVKHFNIHHYLLSSYTI